MREITKWVADDGTEFVDADKCRGYEDLCKQVAAIMAPLPPRPEGCDFENGNLGYLQHTTSVFLGVRQALLMLALRFVDQGLAHWVTEAIEQPYPAIHPSWSGRAISECCPTPFRNAWHRFMCSDKECREWGQPYYRDNPTKAPCQTAYLTPGVGS